MTNGNHLSKAVEPAHLEFRRGLSPEGKPLVLISVVRGETYVCEMVVDETDAKQIVAQLAAPANWQGKRLN